MFVSISSTLLSTLTSHSFNITVIVHDQNHRQAENGVATAIKYLAGNNMGNINKQSMVSLTGQPVNAAGDSKYLILT